MSRLRLYAAPNAARYHRDAMCVGLNSYYTANGTDATVPGLTHAEARRRGLQPCGSCKPPPLLEAVPDLVEDP